MNVGRADINSLLNQMRDMKAATMPQPTSTQAIDTNKNGFANLLDGRVNAAENSPDFSTMFKGAINSVNETQQQSSALKVAYERGDAGVSLSQVMVASQKASVSFDAMTQVRNKVVEAYKDIMNMPV